MNDDKSEDLHDEVERLRALVHAAETILRNAVNDLRKEIGALTVERDELLAQRDAFGQKAWQLQEQLNEIKKRGPAAPP